MTNETDELWPEGCRLLPLPAVTDARGTLSFLEGGHHIPFEVRRVFWITDVPAGATRGCHAHDTCAEALFVVAGSIRLTLDDGRRRKDVCLNRPDCGVLIPAGVWCELTDFAPGTVCVVAASHPYDGTGYVNRYEDYLSRHV